MKFTANIGKVKYELEETGSPQVLKVTRHGPDEQTFFFPTSIVLDYVCHKVGGKVADAIMKVWR